MKRRGLTLLELLMAVIITAMVGAGIAGMLGAVSAGVGTRKDSREVMVLAHGAQCRLSAYLATARCVLAAGSSDVTIWLDDSRESGTVHATEIRWIRYDANNGEIIVDYVAFPVTWTPTVCDLVDLEYASSTDFDAVRGYYSGKGLLASRPLVDHVECASIRTDATAALDSRHIVFDLGFESQNQTVMVQVSGTIQEHEKPVK